MSPENASPNRLQPLCDPAVPLTWTPTSPCTGSSRWTTGRMTTTLIMGCLSLCLIALDTPVPLNAYMTPPAARVAPMQASSSTLTHAAQLRPAQRWYTQRPNEGLQYQGLRQQPARTFRGWWLEADSVSVPVPDSDSVSAQVGPADLDPHVKTYLAVNSAVLCVGGFMAWSTWSILRDLIAGATASLGVMSIGYPLDTAKTRVQIGQPAVDKDGLIGLYRGIPIGLLRESATAAIYIAVCGFLKMHLLPQTHPTAFTLVLFFVVGAVACVASSVARVPLELISKQIQSRQSTSTVAAAKKVFTGPDACSTLRRSWQVVLLREVPYGAFQIMFFEFAKMSLEFLGTWNVPIFIQRMLWGAAAGAGASFLTTPCDVITSRVMTRLSGDGDGPAPTVWQTIRTMYKDEGWKVFWTGSMFRAAVYTPGTCLFFTIFETVGSALG